MTSACGVLLNGLEASSNWTTDRSAKFTLDIDGGLYLFNVLARPIGTDWQATNCTYPCMVGSYQALPYTWTPYKPVVTTESRGFTLAFSVLITGFSLLGCVIVGGLWYVYEGAQKRLEAQELVELQQNRRAAIERGEKFHLKKKRRQLTLWERLTGEVVTQEDDEYDDCLNAEERRKIELYHRSELGADSEYDTRAIPGV